MQASLSPEGRRADAQVVHAGVGADEIGALCSAIAPLGELQREEQQRALRQAALRAVPRLADLQREVEARLSRSPWLCIVEGVDWLAAPPSLRHKAVLTLTALWGHVSGDNAYGDVRHTEDVRPTDPISTDVTYSFECEVHADESSKQTPEDIAALWCVSPAAWGGDTLVWSASEILETLSRFENGAAMLSILRTHRFPFGGKLRRPARVLMAPILFGDCGVRYRRGAILDAFNVIGRRPDGQEMAALDALAEAIRQTSPFSCRLGAGDGLVFQNRRTLHARTTFDDPARWLIRVRAFNEQLSNTRDDINVSWLPDTEHVHR